MTERDEYVETCKQRAREYLDRGDIENAVTSMLSDMSKRPDTAPASALAMLGMMVIGDQDRAGAERFIEGFR